MSRVCELTGKGPATGNNVSHAKNQFTVTQLAAVIAVDGDRPTNQSAGLQGL